MLVRSVEARVARRNSLANVPHLLESDSDSPSGLMLARRSLSDRFKLQVIIKADVSYIVHPIIYPFRRREGWGSAQCQTWQIISAAQLSLPPRGDYLARLVHHLIKLNAQNIFILQPKKLAFKGESSPEDENFNTSSATKSSVMDSSFESNGRYEKLTCHNYLQINF